MSPTLHTAIRPAGAILVAITLLSLPGCSGSDDTPEPFDGAGKTLIGVCQSTLDDPWRVQMNADIQAAAAGQPEWKVELQDAAGDAGKQQQQVEGFIAQKAALIIISPVASQDLTQPVAKAIDAGIPVIVLHRPLVGDKYTCLIFADNYEIGYIAGQWLALKLEGKGRIVELKGPEDTEPGRVLHAGFQAAIRQHPDMRVLHEYPTQGKEAVAQQEMTTALDSFEEIDAVFAHSDATAHGAYLAAEKAGRREGMLLIGIGGLPKEGLAYVREGKLDATLEYPTGGRYAIEMALEILAGKEVPKNAPISTRLFTPESVDSGGQSIKPPPADQ